MSDDQHVHVMEFFELPDALEPHADWNALGELLVKLMDKAAAKKLAENGSGSHS